MKITVTISPKELVDIAIEHYKRRFALHHECEVCSHFIFGQGENLKELEIIFRNPYHKKEEEKP